MQAEIRNLTDTEYRAHPAICNTDLSIAKSILSGRPRGLRSQVKRIGTSVHLAVLEPEIWEKEKLKFPQNEVKQIDKMQKAFLTNYRFKEILDKSLKEVCLFWKDEVTGLECKAKLDLFKEGVLTGDVKTTSAGNRDKFLDDAHRYEYNRQLAFYNSATNSPTIYLIGLHKYKKGGIYFYEFEKDSAFIKEGIEKYQRLLNEVANAESLREEVYKLR